MNYVLIVGIKEQETNLVLGSLLLLTPGTFVNEANLAEYCLNAKLIVLGTEEPLIGHVGREFLSFRATFENQLVEVVKFYDNSLNRHEVKVSKTRRGVCLCRVLNHNQ